MSTLQHIAYTFAGISINDPSQFDTFLRTQLGASIQYNSMMWSPISSLLTVYTNESLWAQSTSDQIANTITLYPNPPPIPSVTVGDVLANPGELLTFDSVKNRPVVLPRGIPGQILTSDATSSAGLRWTDFTPQASSGESITITDANIRYLEMYDSSGGLSIPIETFVEVPFNIERRKDEPTFIHKALSGQITVTEPGPYMISFKIGIQWSSMPIYTNGKINMKMQIKSTSTSDFADIPGTSRYNTVLSRYPNAENSVYAQLFYRCQGGETFRIVITEHQTSTGIIETSPGLSLINICKLDTGPGDYSSFCQIYNSGTVPVTVSNVVGSSTDIPYPNTLILDPFFTLSTDATTLTVASDCGLYVSLTAGIQTIGGSPGDVIGLQLCVYQTDSTGNFVLVPGTCTDFEIQYSSATVPGMKGAIIPFFMYGTAGMSIKTSLTVTSITGSGTMQLQLIPNGTSFSGMFMYNANNVSQGFDAYSSSSVNLSYAFWSDIPIDTRRISSAIFSQDSSDVVIQSSEPGTYIVQYRINTTLTGTNMCTVGSRLVVNGGQGFYEASGSRASQVVTGGRHGLVVGLSLLNLGFNYQLKLQCIISDQGSLASTDVVSTVPNAVEFMFAKFENTLQVLPTPGTLVFGSYYYLATDSQLSSTTSTDYVEKLSLLTPNIPQGTYKITWNYLYSLTDPSATFSSAMVLDDTKIVVEFNANVISSNSDNIFSQFEAIVLSPGIHRLSLQWKTSTNTVTAVIRAAKIEFFRIY